MDTNSYTSPAKLLHYSFLWSEVRLVLAAIALFLGGVPLITKITTLPLAGSLLTISWVLSGVAAGYLIYRWNKAGQKLFGGNDKKDAAAFWVSTISGINLGIVGLLGTNIGMSITTNYIVFVVVGLLYLWSAFYLHKRWKANGQNIF